MRRPPPIFISYAREDVTKANGISERLSREGFEPWMDSQIRAGVEWERAIKQWMRKSDFILVLLSKHSIEKQGYQQTEIDSALALFPQGGVRIVPVRLDKCHLPEQLASFHYVDLFEPSGWSELLQSLKDEIGRRVPDGKALKKRPAQSERNPVQKVPSILTSKGFAYPVPEWLTDAQRSSLSEMAKAAFVLLLFEQTDTGCWSKSYMRYLLLSGDKLPLSGGALSGTPFTLMAISSYAGVTHTSAGGLEPDLVFDRLFEKVEELLQPDGSYLRFNKGGVPGPDPHPELARHAAGACLIRNLYGEAGVSDQKTLKWLCNQSVAINYDRAVVSRLFSQVPYLNSIPPRLQLRVSRSLNKLLNALLLKIESESGTRFVPPSPDMRHDVINQWSTVWYVLPLLTVSAVPSDIRARFISRLRQFLLAQSAADRTGTDLLAREIDESGKAIGKTLFGSGVSLLAWRTLELHATEDRKYSMQAQKAVHRLINSIFDVIEVPTSNPSPKNPESYLGWGAACFAAASVGVHMSPENYRTAVALNEELKGIDVSNRAAQKLKTAYRKAIEGSRLVSPELIGHVARAVARIATNYEPVRKAQTRLSRHSKGR
jgi:hypothetical protein